MGDHMDPRWDWCEITTTADSHSQWIKGRCNHLTPEPVDVYPTGELVRWLCVDCGSEFDPDRWPVPEGMWMPVPRPVFCVPVIPERDTESWKIVRPSRWGAYWRMIEFAWIISLAIVINLYAARA